MSAKQNLSHRLHDQLGDMIAAMAPGDRLPTEPKLAQMLRVSRATLREAMRTFETQGLIQRRQGVGTFVVHPTQVMDTGLEVLESIESMARRVGLAVQMGKYQVETRDANQVEKENLKTEHVHQVSRVIEAEGRPVAYLIDIVPGDLLSESELKQEFTGSVLDLFLKRGAPTVGSADTEIHAAAVESDVARALRIQRGDVVLHFRSSLFSLDGAVIGLTRSYFLPGYFRFHVIRRV
ncbi:MAG: GntR family transcriptional regulator [Anaerolineales bacterium]